MKLFKEENEARQYLENHVPLQEEKKEMDLELLNEKLFDIPEKISPGHHEFIGKHGLKISFDLADASSSAFERCYLIYSKDDEVQGDYHPIYSIENLNIETSNFSYNIADHSKSTKINWLPNLKNKESGLSHKYIHIEARHMYMIDQDGFFSKPMDLLGYFHELGHSETRSPSEMGEEKSTIKTTISSKGLKTEPAKIAAYELQRERDANAWMLKNTRKLFEDLEISNELVKNYIHDLQLRSYNIRNRRKLSEKK